MGKVKKGTIFKIFIVTLLVILSTIGLVLANRKTEHKINAVAGLTESKIYSHEIELSKEDADGLKAYVAELKSKGIMGNVSDGGLYAKLKKYREILCSQHHWPLNDASGYTATVDLLLGSPAQSYVLNELNKDGSYWYQDDPVQQAWWTLSYKLGISGNYLDNSFTTSYGSFRTMDKRLNSVNSEELSESNAWMDSVVALGVQSGKTVAINELSQKVNEYAKTTFGIEDVSGNFGDDATTNTFFYNDSNLDVYNIVIDLINAFDASNTNYSTAANGNSLKVKDILTAYENFNRFIDKVDLEYGDYANTYKEYFRADISEETEKEFKKGATTKYGWRTDVNGNKVYCIMTSYTEGYVLDGTKVYDIFKYTDNTSTPGSEVAYEIGVDLNYRRRPEAFNRLLSRGLTLEQIKEVFAYIVMYCEGLGLPGSGYDVTVPNDLVSRAEAYEAFYEALKADPTIEFDITNMEVKKSDELNAFVVGPIKVDYMQGGIKYGNTYELFGGITEFYVTTDNVNPEIGIKNEHVKYSEANKTLTSSLPLSNNQFALVKNNTTYELCGSENYAYPASNEEFYIVFNAGAGDTQITDIGFNYQYLLHESAYMYYQLVYNGINMQDLAEVWDADLWYQNEKVDFEMPITKKIELIKEYNGPKERDFYFDIYVETKNAEETTDKLIEYDGIVYKYHTEATVKSDGTPTYIDLPEYYRSEYEKQPKVIAVEKDQFGNYYSNKEAWGNNADSLWNDARPINDDGVFSCEDGKTIVAPNIAIDKNFSLEIIKKVSENPNGYTFYARVLIFYDGKAPETYIIPLKPQVPQQPFETNSYPVFKYLEKDNNGYYICKTYGDGDKSEPFGTIETGVDEEGYVYAKWSHTFKRYDTDFIHYNVSEIDENYLDYFAYENTGSIIWDNYECPKYDIRDTIIVDGETEVVKITNTPKEKNLPIKLELSKQVVDIYGDPIEDRREFAFDIVVREEDKEGNRLTKVYQTLNVPVTNPGEELKIATFNYELYQVNPTSKYTIIVEERDVDGYKWSEIVQNLQQEGWQAEVDEDGKILYVFYELNNNMTEFSANFTNINTKIADKHNKFTITKTMKDKDGNDLTAEEIKEYFEKNPDGFVFRVETIRGKELSISDFDESVHDYIVEENGNIYIIITADNYANGISTKDITWGVAGIAPVFEIYEVDKYDNTYLQYIELGQNRPLDSVWHDFRPNDGGHWTVDFFTDDSEAVVINATNTEGTIEKQLSITKEVEGTWDNEDEFYFRILSLDGKKTNIVEEFFDEEYLTRLKNGLKVVKVTKENPTVLSKVLTLSALDELPNFWITEVDQYGEPWSEIPENKDSLWNYYTPEGYGTWTCTFTIYDKVLDLTLNAKNKSNVFTLKKEIVTNGQYNTEKFFEEYPDAEFYFNLYDSEGYAVTNKYFETTKVKTYNYGTVDAIVVNKDNYTGIESLPIAPAAGEKFILHEVFKTKEDENLYANSEEQFRWVIDFTENNNVEITAENIADMTLTIDKVVEGAPDDFLPEEEFYFKVFEDKDDVTNDLFGKDVVKIDYETHQNGGETSRVIYGNHTYTVVEYDAEVNGKTYEEGKDTSDFWKKFTPSNNGKWEVSLGDTKGPSFVEAINYLTTPITIVKETDGDKDQEFGVSLMIWPSEGTNWIKVDGKEVLEFYYNPNIKVSGNKPFTLDGIQWSGEAPKYQVVEQAGTLPTTWSLQGYKVNDTDLVSNPPVQSVIGGGENKIVIINNEDDEVKIPVSKTIVDQFGKPTTLENDETFYFDIYVQPIEGAEYKGELISGIALQEGYNPGKYSENNKYVRIETLEVTVPAGSSNANNVTDIITIPYEAEIDYKVVEVDGPNGNGNAFKDYDSDSDSYWDKFEPTIFTDGKSGNEKGIWTGTLNNKNQVASVANVDAYNKVNKVTIDLEKVVFFEGKLQPIEEGEVFKFIAEYTSSLGREFETETIEITPDNLKYSKTFELLRGEEITYTITEVDPVKNTAYDPDDLTDFWKQFTPVDNGIITGTVDGSSANIPLTGVNIKNVHGWLVLVKEKADWLEHEKFYFEVYEGETNVTETLFAPQNIVEVNGRKVIELNFNRRELYSLEQIWKSGTKAPTYTIKEVEYDPEIYTPDSEIKEVTLLAVDMDTKLTSENAATVAGYATFVNEEVDYDKFEIEKVVKDSKGTAAYNDTFYAKVLDEENKNITETLFDGEDATAEIVTLTDGTKAVKLDKNTKAITENIKVTEKGIKYTVVEVDCDGYSYEDREKTDNKESVWNNGYEPENGTGKYEMILMGQSNKSVLAASIITITNMIDDEPVKYTLTKIVSDAEGNDKTKATFEEGEHFYFKVTDSKGNNVINDLFSKDIITEKDGELIDLSKEQPNVTTVDVYTDEIYTVTETDQYGVSYKDYKKPEEEPEKGWSVWEEYKPSDDKGIWNLNREQTSVIAENKPTKNNAHILLSKQTDYEWNKDDKYKFNVYIKSANSKEEPTPIEVILTKDEPIWEADIEWKVEEGAPSIKVEEVDLPKGVTFELKVGEQTLQPGDYYQLPNVDQGKYTFNCINHAEPKSANFELYKEALNNKVYNFKYEYGYYEGETWIPFRPAKDLKVVANSSTPAISETCTWDFNEATPMFRVWETDGNLESISATNAGKTKTIEVGGCKGIEGTLNPDTNVKIMATNGPEHKGELDLIKTFDVGKDNLLADLQWLANEYEKDGLDLNKVTFKFNISISYDNTDSKFIINGEKYNTWNKEVVWTLPQFIEALEADGADTTVNILRGEGPISVQWAGEAPKYDIDEIIYSNSFWNPERKINCSGQLQCACTENEKCLDKDEAKCVVAEIINKYEFIRNPYITLLTSFAGDVWIENPLEGKTVIEDGIRYIKDNDINSDKFASDVYVIPYRCIVDKDGNIVSTQTNKENAFILTDAEYKYIADKDNGHWEFKDVFVPAFNLNDPNEKALYEKGYNVKYYIDFYYDGMKYEPAKALAFRDENSEKTEDKRVIDNVADYLNLNEGYEKYFDSSLAIETEKDRKEYNAKFATVEGKELYNNGKSTGIIKDANGNELKDVVIDYTTDIAGTIDGSNIIRTTSQGIVNMPINATSDVGTISDYYMRASTTNLGLNYFFKPITFGDAEGELLDVQRALEIIDGREVMAYNEIYAQEFAPVDYAQHINLGLVEREQIDLSIDKKIESVTIIINEKAFTYNYNNDGKFDENLQNSIARFTTTISGDDELYTMLMEDSVENNKLFNVYTSDYYYRSAVYNETPVKEAYDTFMNALFSQPQENSNPIKTKELQIFLTYSLTLSNNSGIYDARINSIADYYDSSLTFVDVDKGYGAYVSDNKIGVEEGMKPGLWAYIKQDEKEHKDLTNIFAKKSKYYEHTFDTTQITSKEETIDVNYKKMVISSTDNEKILVPANSSATYYLTYRADKDFELDNSIILGTKNNIAEIASFTPYMLGTEYTDYAAVIDKDSAPGNYNVSAEISRNIMEDDTDFANVKILQDSTTGPIRSVSGETWLDNEDGSYKLKGQILGNSVKDSNDYVISGLTTKLVEVIDLPVVDENGNITDNYVEYEFYWEGAETATADDGTYVIERYIQDSSTNGSVERPGLVSGNYVVRFFYGDKDATAWKYKLDDDGNKIAIKDENDQETGEFEKEILNINGIDYKTTAYQISEANKAGYINNEWHDLFSANHSDNDARDNEARRLNIIERTQELDNSKTEMFNIVNYETSEDYVIEKVARYLSSTGFIIDSGMLGENLESEDTEETFNNMVADFEKVLKAKSDEYEAEYDEFKKALQGEIIIENGQFAYNGIIDATGYSMFADTAKMNLKVEFGLEEMDIDLENTSGGYTIENINLGLEERSKTNIYLDKQIKEITLTENNGTEFFHVEYDIEYSTKEPGMLDTGWNKVEEGLYVRLNVKEDTLIGTENLQKLDDKFDEKVVTTHIDGTQVEIKIPLIQGFRYINIDSIKLQGLKLDIKYEITAINLSETDRYGAGLANIMDGNETFETAIDKLSSPEYVIAGNESELYFADYDGDGNYTDPKAYGTYLGHIYYQGTTAENANDDEVVKTTVRKIVDYIDNDIEADLTVLKENGAMWDEVSNTIDGIGQLVDDKMFEKEEILDPFENPYKRILVSTDSKEANSEFVKELMPSAYYESDEIANESMATIGISTSKVFTGTDEGRTGMDNFTEILMIENTVGRRDMETVYGNYNPRGGAEQISERDESSAELVTLSPPTGNIENDRQFTTFVAILLTVAVLAGAGVGIKLKISGKSKKSDKSE